MLQMVASSWGAQNPREAADRVAARSIDEQVDADAVQVRSPHGSDNRIPPAAAAYLDRVPAEARTDWMTTIALGYSQTDPQSAPELDQPGSAAKPATMARPPPFASNARRIRSARLPPSSWHYTIDHVTARAYAP